jgi:hypothetical protein
MRIFRLLFECWLDKSLSPQIGTGVPEAGTFLHLRSSNYRRILVLPHDCLADAI